MRIVPTLACLTVVAAASAAQTDNHGIQAVPAPGVVAVDGALADWDLSGSVLQCYDLESLRDVYSAQVAMMWDAEALYVAIRWKDPHPLGNSHDPRYQANKGWAGDSVQLRLKTDRICHLTAWYHGESQQSAMQIEFGKDLHEPFGGGGKVLLPVEGWKLADGAEQAFAADADGRGYVQEMKLPWSLIALEKSFAAGDRLACGIELLWGEADWPLHRYADNLAEGATSREFFWTAHEAWGPVTLSPTGKLTLPVPPYLAAIAAEVAQGPVEIRYALAKPQRVTLALDDAHGRRVRTLIAAAPREAGEQVERWDGLDDDGKPVAPGDYRWNAIRHDGIHTAWTMSFCNPGNPSWDTPDGRGAFYGDHSAPMAASAGGAYVALACPMGEGGKHLIGCDLDGQRLWGLHNRVAFDGGHISLATDGTTLWVANEGRECTIYRVELATGKYAPWAATQVADAERVLDLVVSARPGGGKDFHAVAANPTSAALPVANLAAIALRGRELAVCLAFEDLVRVIDADSGVELRRVAVPAPRSAAWLPDGGLVVLSQGALLRFDGEASRPFTEATFAHGYGLCSDATGNIYLTVRGDDQCVRVFAPDGTPSRTIGKPGGRPHHGAYDREGMRQPGKPTVDEQGHLWVPEETLNPKRTSVWDVATGALVRELVGTTGYAGSGAIDAIEPTRAFSENTIFRIDLVTGASQATWSLGSRGADDVFPPRSDSRSRTVHRDGLVWHYTTDSARGANEVHCTAMKDGRWASAAHLGVVAPHEHVDQWAKYDHPLFAGQGGKAYAWADIDGDGLPQAGEMRFADLVADGTPIALRSYYWGQLPDVDGAVPYLVNDRPDLLVKFPVTGVTACGAPIYDIANPIVVHLDRPLALGGNGEGQLHGGSHGRVYINQDPLITVAADGVVLGGYPNKHTSVHGSHTATSARPGYLIGPSSILGTADLGEKIGEVFYLNGNLGENYLFTHDGLWVQSLFKDCRGWFETPEQAVRGMAFDATTAGGESFGGNFLRTPDGRCLVVIGGTDARVLEVTGLDTIERFMGDVTYTGEQYAEAQALLQRRAVAAATAKELRVPRGAATVDGKAEEWPELAAEGSAAEILDNPRERFGRVAARWDQQKLSLAWRVFARSQKPRNAGQDERLLFKTGDCVDIMLKTDGAADGVRLLVSAMGDQPVAVLYEKTVPGIAEADRVGFSSPWRTISFDRVRRIQGEGVEVAIAPFDGGYLVEAAVPWKLLGATPAAGQKLVGDLGILYADSGGTMTTARRYWSNKATNLVNDVPGEADLQPALWGTLILE